MPYKVKKKGKKYVITKKDSGKVVGHSESKEMADASMKARHMEEHK